MVDAREYHEQTKHDPVRLREADFSLDRSTKPRPYKVYEDLPHESLERTRPPQAPALSILAGSRADPLAGTGQKSSDTLDRETVATLCYEAAGVVERVEARGQTMRFRAASCTGKLYHVDLYLVCGDLDGLHAGVYHVDPDDFGLDVLREGDHRGVLAAATGGHPGVAEAPVTVVATSTWWRNAWKYRDRTYRHAFWDSGTVLANLLAAAHALDYRAEVVAGFADDVVADLVGVDPTEEAPLALTPVGAGEPAPDPVGVDAIDPETVPLSSEQTDYPLIHDAWAQSRLADGDAVTAWRDAAADTRLRTPGGEGERIALDPVDHETASERPLANVIRRRRSCRDYTDEPLSRRKLGTVLDRATRGIPGDWNVGDADGLAYNDVFVLATDVDGVPDGAYQFHPAAAELERVGESSDAIQTELALGQDWAGDAHVNVYCMTDVDAVVDALGNRGYRLAQLEGGLVLGKLYLATYAHRALGGTGLTFFDDEVTDHLSPRGADLTPTTMFALGIAN